jgi:hypothetical protein
MATCLAHLLHHPNNISSCQDRNITQSHQVTQPKIAVVLPTPHAPDRSCQGKYPVSELTASKFLVVMVSGYGKCYEISEVALKRGGIGA